MIYNLGKKFEERVKKDWELSLPSKLIFRLKDQQSGYYGQSSNPCDYFGFTNSKLFMIECKETKGNTFNFAKLTQYDDLLAHDKYDDVYPGALIWFSERDVVVWANISEIKKMIDDGKKSINVKMLETDEYKLYVIPTTKLRTFLRCDFTIFNDIEK